MNSNGLDAHVPEGKSLICRRCEVLSELVRQEGHRDVIRCPVCGMQGDRKEVTTAAAQQISSGIVDELRDGIARSVSGSEHIRYTRGSRPHFPEPEFVFGDRKHRD